MKLNVKTVVVDSFAPNITEKTIPDLEAHCGSWVITRTSTGAVIFETFSREVALKVNQAKYTVQTAAQYLGSLNASKRIFA